MNISTFSIDDQSNIAIANENTLLINKESCFVDGEVEKIEISGNFVYVIDSSGYLTSFDLRNLSNKHRKQVSSESLLDLVVDNERVFVSSMDNTVKELTRDFTELKSYQVKEPYRMAYKNNVIYVSNETRIKCINLLE